MLSVPQSEKNPVRYFLKVTSEVEISRVSRLGITKDTIKRMEKDVKLVSHGNGVYTLKAEKKEGKYFPEIRFQITSSLKGYYLLWIKKEGKRYCFPGENSAIKGNIVVLSYEKDQ